MISTAPATAGRAFHRARSGRFGRAREIYLRVLELDPESHVAWTNVGVIETRLLNHARSTEYYERALEVYPNHHSARKKLAVARQLVAEAQTFLAKNSELDLEAAPLDSLRFHALSRVVIGDRPSAEAIYRVLLRRSAENPRWRIPTLDYQLQSLAWAR